MNTQLLNIALNIFYATPATDGEGIKAIYEALNAAALMGFAAGYDTAQDELVAEMIEVAPFEVCDEELQDGC